LINARNCVLWVPKFLVDVYLTHICCAVLVADILQNTQIPTHSWTLDALRKFFIQNTFLNAAHVHFMIINLHLFCWILCINVTLLAIIIVIDFLFKFFKFVIKSLDFNDIFLGKSFYFFLLTVSLLPQVCILIFEMCDLHFFLLNFFLSVEILFLKVFCHFFHHFNHFLQFLFILGIVEKFFINVLTFPLQKNFLSLFAFF